jgi:hypothetical protein
LFRLSLYWDVSMTQNWQNLHGSVIRTWYSQVGGQWGPSTLLEAAILSIPSGRRSRCSRSRVVHPVDSVPFETRPLEEICVDATALVSVSTVLGLRSIRCPSVCSVSFDCPGSSCPVDAIAAATPVRAHCQLLRWKPRRWKPRPRISEWCCCQQEGIDE